MARDGRRSLFHKVFSEWGRSLFGPSGKTLEPSNLSEQRAGWVPPTGKAITREGPPPTLPAFPPTTVEVSQVEQNRILPPLPTGGGAAGWLADAAIPETFLTEEEMAAAEGEIKAQIRRTAEERAVIEATRKQRRVESKTSHPIAASSETRGQIAVPRRGGYTTLKEQDHKPDEPVVGVYYHVGPGQQGEWRGGEVSLPPPNTEGWKLVPKEGENPAVSETKAPCTGMDGPWTDKDFARQVEKEAQRQMLKAIKALQKQTHRSRPSGPS